MPNEGEGGPSQVFQRAMAHMRAGRFREAKADLEQVLRERSDHAQAVHFMGVIAHAEGDAAHALPYLEKAVAMDDGVYFFHGNLAEAYRSETHRPVMAQMRSAWAMPSRMVAPALIAVPAGAFSCSHAEAIGPP